MTSLEAVMFLSRKTQFLCRQTQIRWLLVPTISTCACGIAAHCLQVTSPRRPMHFIADCPSGELYAQHARNRT